MTDAEFVMMMGCWILAGLVVVQTLRLWHLRRKFIRLVTRTPHDPPAPVQLHEAPAARDDEEMDRIKRRLQVLERIATDGSNRLDSEFEELRRA